MSRRCLIVLVMSMAGSACAQDASEPLDAIALFDRACLQSGGDRSAFEAAGATLGWQRLPMLEGPDAPEWGVGYGSPTGRLMMIGREQLLQVREGGDRPRTYVIPAQVSCAVEALSASEPEQRRAAEFAQHAGFVREADSSRQAPPSDALPGEQFTYWNAPGERSLTIRHIPPNGRLTLDITYLKPAV